MGYKNKEIYEKQEYTIDILSKKRIKKFKKIMSMMPPTGKILDVGCGNGSLHQLLKERDYNDVTGYDFSHNFIKKARKKHPEYKYRIQDACKSFPDDETFDIVISVELLEHVASPYLAIENMLKVCKLNGFVIFSTPNALMQELKHFGTKNWKIPKTVHHYLTPGTLKAMVREMGGHIVYSNKKPIIGHIYMKIKRVRE